MPMTNTILKYIVYSYNYDILIVFFICGTTLATV